MPVPPNYAVPNMVIPPLDFTGVRRTPNVGLTGEQAFWNFRFGLNVAALSCRGPGEDQLIANYNKFLSTHKKLVLEVDKWVTNDMVARHGKAGAAGARDRLSTQVANYWATPPVKEQFCIVAMQLANQAVFSTPATAKEFALQNLPVLDRPFVDFFNAYAQYEVDYATWYNLKPRDASVRLPRGYAYAGTAPTTAPVSVPLPTGATTGTTASGNTIVFAPPKEVTGPAPEKTLPAASTPTVGGTPIIFAPQREVTGSTPVTAVPTIQGTTLPPATITPPATAPVTPPMTPAPTTVTPTPTTPTVTVPKTK